MDDNVNDQFLYYLQNSYWPTFKANFAFVNAE